MTVWGRRGARRQNSLPSGSARTVLVALRVGHDRPWDVALAYVGGSCAESLQPSASAQKPPSAESSRAFILI